MAKQTQDNTLKPALRLDRWLWSARFFKTRALATEAIRGGHVQLGGARVKPAKNIVVGDQLEIRKGEVRFVVEVLALSDRRLSAPLAQQLYREDPASIEQRERQQEEWRLQKAMGQGHEGKPDKRQRRLLHRFRQSHNDGA